MPRCRYPKIQMGNVSKSFRVAVDSTFTEGSDPLRRLQKTSVNPILAQAHAPSPNSAARRSAPVPHQFRLCLLLWAVHPGIEICPLPHSKSTLTVSFQHRVRLYEILLPQSSLQMQQLNFGQTPEASQSFHTPTGFLFNSNCIHSLFVLARHLRTGLISPNIISLMSYGLRTGRNSIHTI